MNLTFGELKIFFSQNTLTWAKERVVAGISQDTRRIKPGELYVAVKGPKFDGHDFVKEAFAKGAAAALVDNKSLQGENLIYCDDSVAALGELAKSYRQKFSQPVIAITGSNGKTTTKEFLTHVLSQVGGVIATKGNLNNHIGVPLTIFSFTGQARFFVVELGMNHPQEIRHLARLARPDYGLITCVDRAHLEGVGGTLEGVARAKGELFEELLPKATALVNWDDPYIRKMPTRARLITYGLSEGADVQAGNLRIENGKTAFSIYRGGKSCAVTIHFVGEHHVRNATAVFALAQELGLSETQIKAGLESFVMDLNRGRLIQKGRVTIIDDTYNANPGSMIAAISSFCRQFPQAFKIGVLGGMRELGDQAPKLHAEVGLTAKSQGVDELYAYGGNADRYLSGFGYAPDESRLRLFTDHRALAQAVRQRAQDQQKETAILLKGSRDMAMEKFLDHF